MRLALQARPASITYNKTQVEGLVLQNKEHLQPDHAHRAAREEFDGGSAVQATSIAAFQRDTNDAGGTQRLFVGLAEGANNANNMRVQQFAHVVDFSREGNLSSPFRAHKLYGHRVWEDVGHPVNLNVTVHMAAPACVK